LQIAARLLIATRLRQFELFSNQMQLSGFAMPLPTSTNCAQILGQNHFAQPNWHALIFFASNFHLQGHILRMALYTSGCDEYVTVKQYFSHPSFSSLLFSNPIHEMA
jgi:hypothetical protein